jgi:hypothetical protein
MYHNYNSLKDSIYKIIENQKSVLNKFPESISRPITQSCSKHLAQFTSYQLPLNRQANTTTGHQDGHHQADQNSASSSTNANLTHSSSANSNSGSSINENNNNNYNQNDKQSSHIIQLETVEQVNWTLENIMYGLTLSHEHQDIIKDCCHIYHDWLTVLLDEPRPFVPQPIRDDPIFYSKKMLWHLYHLFVPRKDTQSVPTKHIMICHGVLTLIESVAKDSKLLRRDLWEEILDFFLAINDAVLSPPFNKRKPAFFANIYYIGL